MPDNPRENADLASLRRLLPSPTTHVQGERYESDRQKDRAIDL